MQRIKLMTAFVLAICFLSADVYASVGDMGFFGGISEGRKLAKTTEQLINSTSSSSSSKDQLDATYKEVIFLSGVPTEFTGNMSYSAKGSATGDFGSYKVTYKMQKGDEATLADLTRSIEYTVNYRTEGSQTIKDYEVSKWTERITVDGINYTLDSNQSKSSISIIEDSVPGVTYYKGDISHRAVYTANGETVTYSISGVIYGYTSAWSSTETQRLNCTVTTPDWQMEFQIRPSVSVSKTLQYSENEPTAISFEGNYKEVMSNKSGLKYNIYTLPTQFYNIQKSGTVSIPSFNTFEQLIAPDTSYLKGHFAEYDIKKLFAMQILDGDAKYYQPNQAITRGQFTQMLVKAIKLPIEEVSTKKGASVDIVFSDVLADREDYPYIMAAFNSGLAVGKSDGKFYPDDTITREEAIVILLRALGLEHLGLDPTPITPFVDDANISSWSKREVYAANRIGIISGDTDGKFNPTYLMSKAEAAAIVNRLIDYMRSDMQIDYTENIVNFAD